MEIKKIPFVPEFQLQNVSSRTISDRIYETLNPVVDKLSGIKVEMTSDKISIQISISVNSSDIEKDPVARLGNVENPYMLSDNLKQSLEPFLDLDKKITTFIIPRTKRGPMLVIQLNTMKTITNLFDNPGNGYEYQIFGIIPQKNNSILQLSKTKIKQDDRDRRRF